MLRNLIAFSHVIGKLYDLIEMSRAVEVDVIKSVLVSIEYSINSVTFWVKYVSINRKTMASPII